MTVNIGEKKLESLIRVSVKKALTEELMALRALALPEISKREQEDVEKRYRRPTRRKARHFFADV